jgi:hypothetical protein
MRTSFTEEEVAREVAAFTENQPWPYVIACPVKNLLTKDGPFPRLGVILMGHELPPKPVPHVLKMSVFNWVGLMEKSVKGEIPTPTEKWLRAKGIECEEFESMEAMVRAGWVGD